jgi:hypothetical protein
VAVRGPRSARPARVRASLSSSTHRPGGFKQSSRREDTDALILVRQISVPSPVSQASGHIRTGTGSSEKRKCQPTVRRITSGFKLAPLVIMAEVARTQVRFASQNGLFQTLIACDTLAFDRREVTIEARPQLANRGRRRLSHRSVELAIAGDSESGTRSPSRAAAG